MRSEQWLFGKGVLGLVLGLALAGAASGQAPVPAPPVPTIWDKLGVTGLNNCLQSKLVNPLGNHPGLEKKPLLKKIADPANLDPKMPKAVQAAAAIKQQEDLAPQKIKAIKYLATMGCGCYQKTVDVRGAMLDALDDCTESVRQAAAEALSEMAGNPCSTCGCTCCSADIMNKLQDMASGKDAKGCFKESSADVRQAAQAALDACRRKLPPGVAEVAPVPTIPPIGEGPKPILPPPTEHPLGVQEMPRPVTPGPHVAPPPAPQPLPSPPSDEKKPLEVPAEPPKSSAAAATARPMASYVQPRMLDLPAAPLPPSIPIPAPQPITSYEPQQPLAIPAATVRPVAVPAAQPERSYVAIVDIKPVTYEARTIRRLPPPAETRIGEQPKVTLRLVIPAEK